jgi:dolichol-phosphate mannosyltransferase
MRILVSIPTYNEKDNIGRMIDSVLKINYTETVKNCGASVDILIIDDNSPDGTRQIVKEFIKKQKNRDTGNGVEGRDCFANARNDGKGGVEGEGGDGVGGGSLFLIEREKKLGLGTAYTAAFNFAVEKGYDYALTMDCDFSHNPEEIAGFVSLMKAEKCGMIVGSRYSGGIRIINWSMKRLLISYFANIYAKLVTGVKISDLTGGFNMYDVSCLKKINLGGISSRGYAFQIEMKYRVLKEAGCSFKEYPIIFYERTMGKSKMSNGIIFEAFFGVIKLRLGFYK